MPTLTVKQAQRRARAEIVDKLTRQNRWEFPKLKEVVATVCNQYDVDFFDMMHALGLA